MQASNPQGMAKPEIKYTQLFINNAFVEAASGKTFATIDPSTEEVICQIAEGQAWANTKAFENTRLKGHSVLAAVQGYLTHPFSKHFSI